MFAVPCAGKQVQQRLWLVCALALTSEARNIALSPRSARYALSPTVAVAVCLEYAAHPAVVPTGGAQLMLVRLNLPFKHGGRLCAAEGCADQCCSSQSLGSELVYLISEQWIVLML